MTTQLPVREPPTDASDEMRVSLARAASLLERAAASPALLEELAGPQPSIWGREGANLWLVLKAVLGPPGVTDREMLDMLARRVRRAQEGLQAGPSCGNCGVDTCASNPPGNASWGEMT